MRAFLLQIKADQYNGHDIISGVYQRDGFNIDFKYSDGFFETEPKQYNPHMATMSSNLANASTTVENGSDFSQGPKTIKDLLTLMGFEDLYASPAYTQGVSIDDVVDAFNLKDTLIGIAKNMLWDYISDYIDQIISDPLNIPSWVPHAPDIDYLINALKESLNENQKMQDIFKNYDGGVSKAVDDLLNFAGQGLKGFSSLDEILTFAYSIGDIYKNHATLQSICCLRTFDDWYVAQ